jgi:hypothetical protein
VARRPIEQERDQNGKLWPAVWIRNAPGHSLSHITLRDYTNQEVKAEVDPSYQAVGVDAAIDVANAAAVEYEGGLAKLLGNADARRRRGGSLEVRIGTGQAFVIQTANKEPEQIEEELAERLQAANVGARASGSPLVPGTRDRDVRNAQRFDGKEAQLKGLDAASITVAVNDPRLGVIMKFRFPDENAPGLASTWGPTLVVALVGGGVLALYMRRKSKHAAQ